MWRSLINTFLQWQSFLLWSWFVSIIRFSLSSSQSKCWWEWGRAEAAEPWRSQQGGSAVAVRARRCWVSKGPSGPGVQGCAGGVSAPRSRGCSQHPAKPHLPCRAHGLRPRESGTVLLAHLYIFSNQRSMKPHCFTSVYNKYLLLYPWDILQSGGTSASPGFLPVQWQVTGDSFAVPRSGTVPSHVFFHHVTVHLRFYSQTWTLLEWSTEKLGSSLSHSPPSRASFQGGWREKPPGALQHKLNSAVLSSGGTKSWCSEANTSSVTFPSQHPSSAQNP